MPTRLEVQAQVVAAAAVIKRAEEAVERAAEARDNALRDAYATGIKVVDLVELLHEGGAPLGRQHIHRIVAGVPHRPTLDINEAIQRYKAGDSLRTLAQHYRVTQPTIKKALQEAGVEIRGREDAKRARREAKIEVEA